MYHGHFINLDRSVDRRERFEKMLAELGLADRYRRHAGVDGNTAIASHATKLSPGALGCWLSHREILIANQERATHLHIVEDDAVFPRDIASLIDGAIAGASAAGAWDIIFTEAFASIELRTFLLYSRSVDQFQKTGQIALLPLKNIEFAGTSSYIVNGQSIGKLLSVLGDGWQSETPIDLFVRQAIATGRLNGSLTMPYLTTISPHAHQSSIRGDNDSSRAVMDIFRRAFFCGADQQQLRAELDALTQGAKTDGLNGVYAEVIRFVFSDRYKLF